MWQIWLWYVFLTYLGLVIIQTVCKSLNFPLPSNGLIWCKDRAVSVFEWIGYEVGRWFNIYDLIKNLKRLLQRVWDFIIDHIWTFIKPFFTSLKEVGQPLWQLLYSPVYIMVGFAKTHYVIFSYLGVGVVGSLLIYYTKLGPYLLGGLVYVWASQDLLIYTGVGVGVMFFGLLLAYPDILPKLFPRTVNSIPNVMNYFSGGAAEEEVQPRRSRRRRRNVEPLSEE